MADVTITVTKKLCTEIENNINAITNI